MRHTALVDMPDRDKRILEHRAAGYEIKEISRCLGIFEHTVRQTYYKYGIPTEETDMEDPLWKHDFSKRWNKTRKQIKKLMNKGDANE